jgi:CheY-like chemotaxis protein
MLALVVEDENDQREVLRETLEGAGWTVEVAEDGIAALGRLRRVEPDVILLDLKMPNMDGTTMLKMLRCAGIAIPVIVTTGSEADLGVRALAKCVLAKPFSRNELSKALASCVGVGVKSAQLFQL